MEGFLCFHWLISTIALRKDLNKYLNNIFNDFIEVEFFIDQSSMCLKK